MANNTIHQVMLYNAAQQEAETDDTIQTSFQHDI